MTNSEVELITAEEKLQEVALKLRDYQKNTDLIMDSIMHIIDRLPNDSETVMDLDSRMLHASHLLKKESKNISEDLEQYLYRKGRLEG